MDQKEIRELVKSFTINDVDTYCLYDIYWLCIRDVILQDFYIQVIDNMEDRVITDVSDKHCEFEGLTNELCEEIYSIWHSGKIDRNTQWYILKEIYPAVNETKLLHTHSDKDYQEQIFLEDGYLQFGMEQYELLLKSLKPYLRDYRIAEILA